MPYTLIYHPSTPPGPVRHVEATAYAQGRAIFFEYALEGDIDALELPAPAPPVRSDGLWQTTCCEAFLQRPGLLAGYDEFNFAPSGAWASYRFAAYREGMATVDLPGPPVIRLRREPQRLELVAAVALDGLDWAMEMPGLRLGLSVVVKDRLGRTGYWACAHPPGKPDFHHPDNFVCTLGRAG